MNRLTRGICMVLFTALALIGCGGGGSANTTTAANVTGKFVDATVVGMAYKCGSSTAVSGTTTANGEYTCPAGAPVAFYVGDILIGSVSAPQAVVTPLDLVGAGASPSHTTVANIVRFLMSISSTNPTSGTLTIDPALSIAAAGKTVNFATTTVTALDTMITTLKPGATLYTSAQATTHVASSLFGLFAGDYGGTFAGTFGGTWSVSIDTNGAVTGTARDSDGGIGAVSGNMATTLGTGSSYAFKGTAGGTPWTGTLNISTQVFSGTWNDGAGSSGTFTGKLTAATSAPSAGTGPTVSSFSPATGAVGTSVSITGTNLGSFIPAPLVKFGTTNAGGPYTNVSNSNITFTVPAGLAAGAHTLTVSNFDGTKSLTVGTFIVAATVGGT